MFIEIPLRFSYILVISQGVVIPLWCITTAHLHSTKSIVRFCTSSNPVGGVSEICDGEDLWYCSHWKQGLTRFVGQPYRKKIHQHHQGFSYFFNFQLTNELRKSWKITYYSQLYLQFNFKITSRWQKYDVFCSSVPRLPLIVLCWKTWLYIEFKLESVLFLSSHQEKVNKGLYRAMKKWDLVDSQ